MYNKNNISYYDREPETIINSITIRAISKREPIGRIWFDNTEISNYVFKSSIILFFIGDIRTKFPNLIYNFIIQNYISETEVDLEFLINQVDFFVKILFNVKKLKIVILLMCL